MNLVHDGSECTCLSSDRMGAYIHVLSIDPSPRDSVSSPLLSSPDMAAGGAVLRGEKIPGDLSALVSRDSFSTACFGTVCVSPSRCVWVAASGYL